MTSHSDRSLKLAIAYKRGLDQAHELCTTGHPCLQCESLAALLDRELDQLGVEFEAELEMLLQAQHERTARSCAANCSARLSGFVNKVAAVNVCNGVAYDDPRPTGETK